MSRFILSRPIVAFVLFVERWLLSALFLFLVFEYLQTLWLMDLFSRSQDLLPSALIERDGGLSDGCQFSDYARYSLLAACNLVPGVLLLISRKPRRNPTRAREVVIPLMATFSYLGFNRSIALPAWMTTPVIPPEWEGLLAAAGVALSSLGACVSLAAVMWLGRSLGIIISVRRVVLNGPYRCVRHPIYLGYLIILAGMLLTAWTFHMFILTVGAGALLIWRARMEEELLSQFSPAYREWVKHTGFLWMRWPRMLAPTFAQFEIPQRIGDPTSRAVGSASR